MKQKSIQICPSCKSTDIETDFSAAGIFMGLLQRRKCKNCGYEGSFFPIITKEKIKKTKTK
ncbi:MAG TPA: TFIIB-type zinc ribbon-containing protein [Candidatus Nanoarchaeia archaeon]|nr:TFIIB-type zinc ribbon-containing protein [Candidatus Nanoarchaeia archaeon]